MTIDKTKIQNYIWKNKKEYSGDDVIQDFVPLIDASQEQLQSYYDHCMQMLYNDSPDKPGRYNLLVTVNKQRSCCNAELFVRYLRSKQISQSTYFMELRNLINNNKDLAKNGFFNAATLQDVEGDNSFDPDFQDLKISDIMDACLDKLGSFDKSHLTTSFILKQGLWLTEEELADLTEYGPDGEIINRKDIIKDRLSLKRSLYLKIDPKGISYSQFRAMVQLKNKKYSELTSEQLTTLRDRILFALEDDILYHIEEWNTRKQQILEVAEYKGYEIDLREDLMV